MCLGNTSQISNKKASMLSKRMSLQQQSSNVAGDIELSSNAGDVPLDKIYPNAPSGTTFVVSNYKEEESLKV